MDINPASRNQTTPPGPGRNAPRISSDFDTFLRMLTTQLQNQDPLNPIDSADYAVQLATFSGVEQQVRTNTLLTALAGRFELMGMAQLSGWVGQEALTTAPVQFDGTPVTLVPAPRAGSDAAFLIVRDSAGRVVARESLPLDGKPYRWLGGGSNGNPLPSGRYTLSIESQTKGKVTDTSPAPAYSRISEARRDGDGVVLLLSGGVQVRADQVTGLRKP